MEQQYEPPSRDATSRKLTVTAAVGRELSKNQKAFNRLIRRVESLRREIKDTAAQLDRALQEFEREVRPRLDALTLARKDIIRALAPFLSDPRLKRASDREVLASIVSNLLDDVAEHEGELAEADLRALYESLTQPRDAAEEAEEQAAFAAIRSQVESMFNSMGVKIDLSDIGPDTPVEKLHARVAQAMNEADSHGADGRRPSTRTRRPTRKQLERERRLRDAEEARKRTIGSIYKQLAKTLHPDLELDPERRAEKLALMQELTAAHRANDLHTLLRLELEWLHREEGDIDHLTEEKLAVFVSVLREQVAELEQELAAVRHHPRYQPLVVEDFPLGARIDLFPSHRIPRIDALTGSMRRDLERLRGPEALREVREILKAARAQR